MMGWKERLGSLYILLGILYGPCAVALYISVNGYGKIAALGGIFACAAYIATIVFNENLRNSLPVVALPKIIVIQTFGSTIILFISLLIGVIEDPNLRLVEFITILIWIVFIVYLKVSAIISQTP